MKPVPGLCDHVPHTGLIREVALCQNIRDNPYSIRHVPVKCLDSEDYLLPIILSIRSHPGCKSVPKTSGLQSHTLCHFLIAHPCCPHTGRKLSQQGEIRLKVFRDIRDIKGKIKIGNPVCKNVVLHGRNV